MNYQALLEIARQKMDHPQVVSILVSPRTFALFLAQTQPVDARVLGEAPISASDFAPDDVALGRDHEGRIIKMWML